MTHPNQTPSPSDIRQEDVRELLPCPFCGGADIMEGVFYAEGELAKRGAVRCADCGVRAPTASWNTRAALSAQTGEPVAWRQSDEAIRNMIAREIWRYQECEEAYGTFDDDPEFGDPSMRSLIKQTVIDQAELIRAVVLASPVVKAAIARMITEDDVYEIGKRDGYEDAIQTLDVATGGDGEFCGSTIPDRVVDVPVMQARVIERFLASPPPQPDTAPSPLSSGEVRKWLQKIVDLADAEDAAEPLDDAINYANKALATLSQPPATEQISERIKVPLPAGIDDTPSIRAKMQSSLIEATAKGVRNLAQGVPPPRNRTPRHRH